MADRNFVAYATKFRRADSIQDQGKFHALRLAQGRDLEGHEVSLNKLALRKVPTNIRANLTRFTGDMLVLR
jgi:hypothetical protein